MKTGTRLTIAPRAAPAVAPQLVVQSALLALNLVELDERIEQEVLDNPALVEDETACARSIVPPGGMMAPGEGAVLDIEDTICDNYTIQDDLELQFAASAPTELHEIGRRLIATIDEAGYLHADVFEVARELGVAPGNVQAAIEYLQQLEPAGVGARTPRECLLLQVRRLRVAGKPVPEGIERVIAACEADTGADLVRRIAQTTGLKRARVEGILRYIRQNLHPFPGYLFAARQRRAPARAVYVYPDVIIRNEGEHLGVEVPMSRAEFLRLNQAYLRLERAYRQCPDCAVEPGAEQVLEQLQRARNFLQMLQRRRKVLQMVASAVVKHQWRFILWGPAYHRPLYKKQIAAVTGLHEASVCRATKGKYVMLPDGEVVEFDVFFATAVPIKHVIADLVRRESRNRPLSDSRIVQLLAQQGYTVARRTVAKYRQALGIPGSAQRRRQYQMGGNLRPACTASIGHGNCM